MDEKNIYRRGLITGIITALLGISAVILMGTGVFAASGGRIMFSGNESQLQAAVQKGTDGSDNGILDSEFEQEAGKIYQYMQDYFLYDFEDEELKEGMLYGLVASLGDPYSSYYNASDMQSFMDSTEGEYYGIGAAVSQNRETGIITISKPYAGTPSFEAGLLPGDILYKVDGKEVTGISLDQVVAMIKGKEGTTVTLTIIRDGESDYLDIDVERRKVEIPTVEYEMLEDRIGYIAVSGFEGVTADQFKKAYEELSDMGMEKVIIDLRDNGGGLVNVVIDMLDYLLPAGDLFYVKDKNGTVGMEYESDENAALTIPLAVLVNGNSASASEVFAGNVKEFGVGTLVGTTTFGKGIMQQMFYTNAANTAGIKLTVADYYIHGGVNIHEVGIEPDVEEELDEEAAKMPEIPKDKDNQLQKAIEVLNEK